MNRPFLQRVFLGLFLMALVASTNVSSDSRKTEKRAATISDCSLMNNPDIIKDPKLHIQEISTLTSDAAARIRYVDSNYRIVRQNYIDDHIFNKMVKDGIQSAPLSSDEEFLRRVTLDLTGRIPSATDVKNFLSDTSSDKRQRYIDSLIGSPAFVDRWTMWMGDLLKNTAVSQGVLRYYEGRNAFYYTIRQAIERNTPYNQFVSSLITSSGKSFQPSTGGVNYIVGAITPMGPIQDTYDTAAVQAATRFLGIETLDCLLCHSGDGHLNALNLWATKTERVDAQRMAAFFSRTGIRRTLVSRQPVILESEVFDLPNGEYRLNTTSGNRTPREPINGAESLTPVYIFTGETPGSNENYRAAFARILTKDKQFARATVNYLWAHFFGVGIVDPPTNFDLARLDPNAELPEGWSVQPSHPELLEQLADDFIASGYNLQHIMKVITKSSAYQLSSRYEGEWKEEYTPYFARKLVRRLDAEEIHDAILSATGIGVSYPIYGLQNAAQTAMQLPDTNEPLVRRESNPTQQQMQTINIGRTFLNIFERGNRDDIPRKRVPSISQSLAMMNNTFVTSRISAQTANSNLQKLLAKYTDDQQFVQELFLTVLSRQASKSELNQALEMLKSDRNRGAEDLMWVLMNKIDFLYNY